MNSNSPLKFVESAKIEHPPRPASLRARIETASTEAPLDLDKLPTGVVTGNTLIDYSAASEQYRGGMSLALAFANRATLAEMGTGANEDDWFASYKTNLARIGFSVSQGAFVKSTFSKRGLAVHKAIIPFLTAALGGAGVGPVLLALLTNLKKIDEDKPWISLFDQESRIFETREVHFGAVVASAADCQMRHVAARLRFVDKQTNVLFFQINDTSAEFESATTTLAINSALLTSIEPALRDRLAKGAIDFIKRADL